jgi:glycoside/pentoside/hexuronide:cation symporter, GPH family
MSDTEKIRENGAEPDLKGKGVVAEEVKQEFEQWNTSNSLNFSRVMYCMGSIARIDNTIQNYYLNPFLLDVVGLKPSLTGNVLLIKQICDAITDPFVGFLSDHARTRFGRRKPFIYLASPVLWSMWILLWTQITKLQSSQLAMFFYYLLVLLVYNISSSTQAVPYRALMQDIAPTYGIRTRIVALYEMTAMIAFTIVSLVHGVIIESFYYPGTDTIDYQFGYIVSALIFAPIIAFTRVITSQFVHEAPLPSESEIGSDDDDDDDDDNDNDENESKPISGRHERTVCQSLAKFASIWWSAVSFRDFTLLVFAWTFSNVMLALVTSNIVLYVKYYYRKPGMGKIVVMVLQLGIALSLPVWAFIIKRIGKRYSLFSGCAVVSAFFLGFFFLGPDQLLLFMIFLPFAGCAAGSLYICLTSMQPDCVQAYYNQTKKR